MRFPSEIIVMLKPGRKKEEGVDEEQQAGNSSAGDSNERTDEDDIKVSDTEEADYKRLEESWDREMYS